MNRLPAELLCQIASYFTFEEKKNLLLVCHHWHKSIQKNGLYADFSISNTPAFESGVSFFKRTKEFGRQTRSLRLLNIDVSPAKITSFPQHLPNLQEVTLIYHEPYTFSTKTHATIKRNAKYWDKITSFSEVGSLLSPLILKFGGFSNLTKLVVGTSYENCVAIINHISNAKNLKELEINNQTTMTLFDLEELHTNAPQLKSLRLAGVIIRPHQDEPIEARTVVATELTTLYLGFEHALFRSRLMSPWLTYMAEKYKHLQHLSLVCEPILSHLQIPSPQLPDDEEKLIDIISGNPLLQSYNVNLIPITPRILKALEATVIKLKAITLWHNNSIECSQGSSLTTFVDTLRLNLINSPVFCGTVHNLHYYDFMQTLSRLKHLELEDTHHFIYPFEKFLQEMKNLKTLKIRNWDIPGTYRLSYDFQASLEEFSFSDYRPGYCALEGVMRLLSQTCPNLSKLSIKCYKGDVSKLAIYFPNNHFKSIEVNVGLKSVYKVNNQRRIVCYDYINYNSKSPPPTLQEIDEPNQYTLSVPYVTITYQSCSNLILGRCYVPNC